MDSQTEKEIREEIAELEEKKSNYGWTRKESERYHYLKKLLGEE
jgi:hypothetical protein